jgi:hypothetical protein
MITPGTWTADGLIVRADRRVVAIVTVQDGQPTDSFDNVRLIAGSKRLLAACEATLLLHRSDRWGTEAEKRWRGVVGDMPPTPQALCDFVRRAMTTAEGYT